MVTAVYSWNAVPGALSYDWYLLEVINNIIVDSGNTTSTSVTISNLDYSTTYEFYIYTNCEGGLKSEEIKIKEQTPGEPVIFDLVVRLDLIEESVGGVVIKPTDTSSVTAQTLDVGTNMSDPLTIGHHHYNVPDATRNMEIQHITDPIVNNTLFLYIDNLENYVGNYNNMWVIVRVSVDNTYIDEFRFQTTPTPPIPIELNFNDINVDLSALNGQELKLNIIYVSEMYRGVDSTNFLNTLYPGLNYPTT